MDRPFRRYCFHLAERLTVPVSYVLENMTAYEISEWMAFDLTRDEEWETKWKRNKDRELTRQMSVEEKQRLITHTVFGGVVINGNSSEPSSKDIGSGNGPSKKP